MFVFNVKVNFSKGLKLFLASSAIISAVLCIVCMISVQSKIPDTATCDELSTYSLYAKGENGRKDFLKQFGLSAKGTPVAIQEVKIPSDFNSTYEAYNRLQIKIGLDLSRQKGEQATKYTYELNGSKKKYAVILVCQNKVIGGHLTSGEYGSPDLPLI